MKLSKVKFQNVSQNQELSKDAQKLILGGYSGSTCCFYVVRNNTSIHYHCVSSATEAESGAAGVYGTWACGTEEAKSRCGC